MITRLPTRAGAAALALLIHLAPAAADDDAPGTDIPPAAAPQEAAPAATPAEAAPAQRLPIQIEALDGIEWRRDDGVAIARGSVRAVRGDTVVLADELTARYRTNAAGDTEVWRIEGRGNVQITRRTEKAFGDLGVYDLDTEHLLLTAQGRPRVVTPSSEISGKNRVEYFVRERRLVAEGDAIASDREKTVRGDVISVLLSDSAGNGGQLARLDATGNASVVKGADTYRGNRLAYNAETDIAALTGSVTITQGKSRLDGCRGVANLKTGVSNLYGCDGTGDARKPARGLIIPGGDGKS